jgi:ankyrin repeat protein
VDSKGARSPLHVVADWPGHFPNGSGSIRALLLAGADPNARVVGCSETPLHWAASSDDVAILDALLDACADIEAPGACIAGGTALDDAVAFGQWRAARRLVERGARTAVWHSSALGLMDRVEAYFAGPQTPPLFPWGDGRGASLDEVTIAFWCACHGGQRPAAEYLLDRGAKLNWISDWDGLTPLDAAQRADAPELIQWLRSRGAKSAKELKS